MFLIPLTVLHTPHLPLVAPQEFYDLCPLEHLPADKLHPRAGYRQHPWIATTERTSACSEHHAIGSVSGAFTLRKVRSKLIEYLGIDPELFDLESDPEQGANVAQIAATLGAPSATPPPKH